MAKRRLSRRESVNLNRVLYSAFLQNEGRIDGDVAHVADALRMRGISIFRLMDKDPAVIIREAENEWLRKRLRDLNYPIDGQAQRAYHYDGSGWLHMPLRLWLNTRNPDAPDITDRRKQVDIEISGIIAQIPPMASALKSKKKGWETTRAKVRQGALYEQPQLLSDQDTPDVA